MKQWTLKKLCVIVRVSKRDIQDYEKMGMVTPIGKNKHGHLLYDENAVKNIRIIKMYRKLGFSVKATAYLMNADDIVRKACVRSRMHGIKWIFGKRLLRL